MRAFLILLLVLAGLEGQAGGADITGRVRDAQNGSPLQGANVILSGGRLPDLTGTATDGNGEFLIPRIPAGEYQLQVTYIGYRPFEQAFRVPTGTDTVLTFQVNLQVESIRLRGYVITASRGRREKITDAPAATIVMSATELARSTNPNIGDYFKHIKGVDFTASGIDA
ncbi:MAG: carboxypeptidase-like regulatory domain-containing protein, partial [Fidelibacterota bacterium]